MGTQLAFLTWLLTVLVADAAFSQEPTTGKTAPDFTHDIQPIFARACTSCHGGVKQAADFSFVDSQTVLPPEGWIIEPGAADDSILLERIVSDDPELRMPPPHEHPDGLTDSEIELIRRWIDAGAKWKPHWSRAPLQKSELDRSTESMRWAKSDFDLLVRERLDSLRLSPAPESAPAQWLRRVSLDVIGLPPSPKEISDFEQRLEAADSQQQKDDAYAEVVDRLLKSQHFGERWASMWMDLSRYADSKGYEKDPHRDIWPYRDWLVKAFNQDMPYDEFTVKQLAGDLLPDASYQDLIASAFHRNTQTNTEGGTDDEEFRIAAVLDRVNTTWTVWQATTFGCVQCHAHPYEPFDNEEYYQSVALFNSTEDVDLDSEYPTIPMLADDQQPLYMEVGSALQEALKAQDELGHQLVHDAEWQPLTIDSIESTSGELGIVDDNVRIVGGTVSVNSTYTLHGRPTGATAIRIHILPESDSPADWPEQGSLLSQLKLSVIEEGEKSRAVETQFVIPDSRGGPYHASSMLESGKQGFGGYPKLGGPRWVVVTFTEPLELGETESLKIELIQKDSVTGGLATNLRHFRIEFSSSPRLSAPETEVAMKDLVSASTSLQTKLSEFQGVDVPIMLEQPAQMARQTRRFIRGNWLERGEVVSPGIPRAFQSSQPRDIPDRLAFANWLVSDQNPLAARVWANRIWSELFGIGIVETLEDFGVSGQPPSHLELLDFLALRIRGEHQWHLKPFLRELVLSATYRQDHRATPAQYRADPRNQNLARGPRTRLTAEMVRDQALFAAERLTDTIGGPSVMPPQPDGVWQQAYSNASWKVAEGADRYRRGIYTYWRRTSPYPSFVMFDTPTRDVCSARRIATNTPLQALVTLNSEVFTELAQMLGENANKHHAMLDDAIIDIYLRVTSRRPGPSDLEALLTLYHQIEQERLREAKTDRPPSPDRHRLLELRLTPLATVALAILNSDLALTK